MCRPFPRLSPVGESAVLVELADAICSEASRQVRVLDARLRESSLPGVIEWVPGYDSVLVHYDPLRTTYDELHALLENCLIRLTTGGVRTPKQVTIAVRYGGEDGPDLAHVASYHGLTEAEVIRRHTAPVYQVAMMGFTPGFAYLIGLDSSLNTPRLATPMTLVPAGSVGIAGGQTGIYPLDSPGGWQLIGRTACKLFNPDQAPFFLISPGDAVRFVAVENGERS